MRLDIGVYGVLLAAGLGMAYWASLPVQEGEDEKVQVFSLDPKAVVEIAYSSKDGATKVEVEAAAVKRPGDERFWVAHSRTEAPKPVDDGANKDLPKPADPHGAKEGEAKVGEAKAAEAPKEPVVTKDRFLANEKMDELLQSLNPLTASRVFTKVDAAQLEEFGLKAPTQRFTVKGSGGQVLTLWLGRKSYGSSSRFVQEEGADGKKGRVLLVEDRYLENLERAPQRLYDRRLLAFEFADAHKATIAVPGQGAKRLAHTQRDKAGELLWTDDEEGAQAKPSYDSWMDKVGKLRLSNYASEAEDAQLKDAPVFLEIAFEKDGKVVDTLRFKKQPGDKPAYWVISDFLKTHAKLVPARVEPIEKDLAAIMAGAKPQGS